LPAVVERRAGWLSPVLIRYNDGDRQKLSGLPHTCAAHLRRDDAQLELSGRNGQPVAGPAELARAESQPPDLRPLILPEIALSPCK
jgi:hypothetical protein